MNTDETQIYFLYGLKAHIKNILLLSVKICVHLWLINKTKRKNESQFTKSLDIVVGAVEKK